MFDKRWDVFEALAKRRQVSANNCQSVIEVFAEEAFVHLAKQVAVGCRHDANVELDWALAAEPAHLTSLERAEQLWLELDRKLAELVQKDRATAGALEDTRVAVGGSGESAALESEKLTLDQVASNRAAVENDKRPAVSL